MKQFDKVTEGMERMQAMMGTELERAAETGKVADQTSNTIKMTQNEHGTLAGRLRTAHVRTSGQWYSRVCVCVCLCVLCGRVAHAKGLVSKFRRRDQTDKILIGFAALVFVLTCIYVIRKRLPAW